MFGVRILPENTIRSGTGSTSITTCRAVKTNQVEIERKIKTIPMRTPITHLKMIIGFGLLYGGLDRKDIGSIFIGVISSRLSWIMSTNVTP
jgi:hypothetical protein